MVPAAIEVVGRIGIAKQAGEPQAQVARVDRDEDVALVVDDVLERRQRVAPLAQHRVVGQALLAAEVAAVEGHADVVAGRHRAFDVTQLRLHVGLERAGNGGRELQVCALTLAGALRTTLRLVGDAALRMVRPLLTRGCLDDV